MGYYGAAGDFYMRPRGDLDVSLSKLKQAYKTPSGLQKWFPAVGSSSLVHGAKIAAKAVGSMFDGGETRRYRRMNPLNPRALRRAIRRATSFERFAKSVIRVTHSKGRSKWKFQRKRRR